MIEIKSRDAKLAAFKHYRVAAPVVEPQAGCIYRITPKGHAGKSSRQNGFLKAWNAARAAEEIWPGAKEGADYTLYQHDGLHGFIPFGGTPQPSMGALPVAPVQPEATPSQRRDAFNELSSVIDAATGRYESGWTDAAVAAATGLPVVLIAEVRVQFYGEPKPDLSPEAIDTLKALKAETDAIVGAHRKLADVAEGLSHRIELALKGL